MLRCRNELTNFKKYEPINFNRPLLGECEYFSTYEYLVSEKNEINADKESFVSITFIEGSGKVNLIDYSKGDTFFIPSGTKAKIEGRGKYVLTTIK